jgi:antirestriction protein ArdC
VLQNEVAVACVVAVVLKTRFADASRLDRSFGRKRFGDEGYAMEELVAELGAAFLSADLSLTPEPREDHAAYIGHWLNALKNDKRAIFTAASHAQRAADFLYASAQPRNRRPHSGGTGFFITNKLERKRP